MDLFRKTALATAITTAASASYAATLPAPQTLATDAPAWQRAVAVAGDGKGKFIHVWNNNGTLYAQYSQGGIVQGNSFVVGIKTNDTGKSISPNLSVSMDSAGDAMVAWTEISYSYNSYSHIRKIPSGSTETPSTPDFVLNDISGLQIAMDDSGNFTVAGLIDETEYLRIKTGYSYDNYGTKHYSYDNISVQHRHPVLRRFDVSANELPIKDNLGNVVNDGHIDSVECKAKNNRSTWEIGRNGGVYNGTYSSYQDSGRVENLIVSSYGGNITQKLFLDDYSYAGDFSSISLSLVGQDITGKASRDFCRPTVSMNGAGQTVVTWANNGHIQARRYDNTGQAGEALPIQVDNTPQDDLDWQSDGRVVSYIPVKPVVAMDSAGSFIVAWPQLKTRVKATPPKEAEYESGAVEFRHELSASVMAQRFEAGKATHLKKGIPADAELVKETEKVDQDISIAISDSSHFTLAWSSRFEDFKQYANLGVFSNLLSVRADRTNSYQPTIKGNVFTKNFVVKKGLLSGYGATFPIAAASKKTVGSDAFSAHWLPAIASDNKGNLDVLWIQQRHLDDYYHINNYDQMDKFDSLSAFIPGKLK